MSNDKLLPLTLIICAALWAVVVFSASQKATQGPVADEELISYAREVLSSLQSQSFEQDREFCGVIYRNPDGSLNHTDVFKGERDTCTFEYPESLAQRPRASFHTHGAFDPEVDSEVPSLEDISGDIADRVLGFISTPGGRLWMVDWDSETATLVCGQGCLPTDPKYRSCGDDPDRDSYSIEELRSRFDEVVPDLIC